MAICAAPGELKEYSEARSALETFSNEAKGSKVPFSSIWERLGDDKESGGGSRE